MTKVRKAEAADGPAFINVFAPCDRGWRYEPEDTMAISRLAVETALWPLYEVENGKYKLNGPRRKSRPITDYLASQGDSYNHPNAAIEPRIPGIFQYYSVAEDELAKIYAGQFSAQDGANNIAAAWEKITDQIGRERQVALYKASLGL